ncbi:MAG: glutathione transport system permease protein [Actinomycetota bacterium]|jgi:peptide/nickel transport system permease protein|nr:glutathione transport system permease protein [Actinomycetota bacterium]
MPDLTIPAPDMVGTALPGPAVEREFTAERRSQTSLIVRRFLQHRLAVFSLGLFLLLVLTSLFGDVIWHYKNTTITDDLSLSPSLKHPMGTDSVGHDLLAQVLAGTRISVLVALLVALISTAFGTVFGALSGFYGGRTDTLMMRFVDLLLTIPSFAILVCLSTLLAGGGGSPIAIALILASLSWLSIARVIRGLFLSLREKEYVEAARCLGATNRRIIFRHLLPNAVGPIIVNATITVAFAILSETALSYLGFGIKYPSTSLGLLISVGQSAASTRPWLFYFPGLVIILIALTVNFVGDGLRDALDPQQNRVRA